VGATHASPLHGPDTSRDQSPGPKRKSLGAIVGSFKSAASKRTNESRATPGVPVWQRNYYERVVRASELEHTRTYILENPIKWDLDDYRVTERAA
jgi:putative transposase